LKTLKKDILEDEFTTISPNFTMRNSENSQFNSSSPNFSIKNSEKYQIKKNSMFSPRSLIGKNDIKNLKNEENSNEMDENQLMKFFQDIEIRKNTIFLSPKDDVKSRFIDKKTKSAIKLNKNRMKILK